MTRRQTREHYNKPSQIYTYAIYPGDNSVITVTRDGIMKTVKVVNDFEFIYKLQKTQIKAKGGAEGLYKWIDDTFFKGFGECLAYKVLDHIIDTMTGI